MKAAVGRNCHIHLFFLQASPYDDSQHPPKGTMNTWQRSATPELHQTLHASTPYQCADTQFCFLQPVYPKTCGLTQTLSQHRAEVHTRVKCRHSQIFRAGTHRSLARGTTMQGSVLAFHLPPSPQEPVMHSYRWANPLTADISEGQGFTWGLWSISDSQRKPGFHMAC